MLLTNWWTTCAGMCAAPRPFLGQGMAKDKEAAFITLYTVLEAITRLTAPFTPFMAESIYQNLVRCGPGRVGSVTCALSGCG